MASNLRSSSTAPVGQDFAGLEIAIAAEVEVDHFVLEAFKPATAWRTFTPSAATSGPVPSPPMTAILVTADFLDASTERLAVGELVKASPRSKEIRVPLAACQPVSSNAGE